jgi:hypothetical protein
MKREQHMTAASPIRRADSEIACLQGSSSSRGDRH